MKVFVLLCCVATALAHYLPAVQVNHAPVDSSTRMISGIEAVQGQFPWQAGIFHTVRGRVEFCGGALISDQYVLTAGHCVQDATDFRVVLGASKIYEKEEGSITVGVEMAIAHPRFNYPARLNNDVGLLKLDRRVTLSRYIQPIRMATEYDPHLGPDSGVYVSGWGKTHNDDHYDVTNTLTYNPQRTITNLDCKQSFSPSLIQDNVACIDGVQLRSACNGDSGSPMVQFINDEPVHVGLVSFVSTDGCSTGAPSGYTRTASHLDFIQAYWN